MSETNTVTAEAAQSAANALDAHVREIIAWHFSPETGCPFWLDWAKTADFDPLTAIQGVADLTRFPHFQDEWLRDEQNERFIPKAFAGRPFFIFETGGTTGMPKQRIGWEDHLRDYEEFSGYLDGEFPDAFPKGENWLMLGPTGPRRLRLAIEHLAHVRGGSCYHVDLDPRWVKRLIGEKDFETAKRYKKHVAEQGATILKNRKDRLPFHDPVAVGSVR